MLEVSKPGTQDAEKQKHEPLKSSCQLCGGRDKVVEKGQG